MGMTVWTLITTPPRLFAAERFDNSGAEVSILDGMPLGLQQGVEEAEVWLMLPSCCTTEPLLLLCGIAVLQSAMTQISCNLGVLANYFEALMEQRKRAKTALTVQSCLSCERAQVAGVWPGSNFCPASQHTTV